MLHRIHLIIVTLFLLLLSAGITIAEENQLIIAVAAEDRAITSRISAVAARAHYFHFFDKQANLLQTLQNPYADAGGGAGPKAADFLIKNKAGIILAGKFGKKMENAHKAGNIQYFERQGVCIDAVKELNHGQ